MRDEEGVFGEYADESRIVCSSRREAYFVATKSPRLRNGEIATEYGDIEQALKWQILTTVFDHLPILLLILRFFVAQEFL